MPVKKTVKKTSAAKKPVAKKVVSKATTSKVVSKPVVIVETKKTNKGTNTCEKTMRVLIFALLILNLGFGLFNLFKKDSALQLEELKVGGSQNLQKVMDLYNSDAYKAQQTAALQQFIAGQ